MENSTSWGVISVSVVVNLSHNSQVFYTSNAYVYTHMRDETTDLPQLHELERNDLSPVEQLEIYMRRLDGPLSASNAYVPNKAVDIGDVDTNANPSAADLSYSGGEHFFVEESSGRYTIRGTGDDETIEAGSGSVIDNVRTWA